ncbi:MAG: D-alanine--D-alanine ligase [Flavobacteriaceae bacterium]
MKKNIAIVMGGYSKEVDISLQSGQVVADNLDSDKYSIYKIHILIDKWVCVCETVEIPVDKSNFSILIDGEKLKFDIVFNAIHGNPGENGALVAYFEILGIKHTSAPFYQMALTFNKFDTISVLRQFGILTAKSIHLNKSDVIDVDAIVADLNLPCFVKANNAGSSFGVYKVHNKENLKKAILDSFKEDDSVLIESFLDGTEVSVGVVNLKGITQVIEMTEIVSENDFFDYEAKYLGKSQEITPARISTKERELLKVTAIQIYDKLNMKGMSRSDFMIIDGKPYFIEMNTVPGLASESILPQQVRANGRTLTEFFGLLIEDALI